MGAVVYFAIWIGFIRPEAFGGYAADAASIAIAIGLGCFAIGALFAVGSMAARVFGWIRARKQQASRTTLLLQNIGFLTPPAQLILYMGLREPQGRFPSLGEIAPMRLLVRYNIVVPEGSYSLKQGHIVKVTTELFHVRDLALSTLTMHLEGSLKINLADTEAVRACLNEMIKSEPNWWV